MWQPATPGPDPAARWAPVRARAVCPVGRDAPDAVSGVLGEPDPAVGPDCYPGGLLAPVGQRILGHVAGRGRVRRYAADRVVDGVGEPHVAVGPLHDPPGLAHV